MVVFLTGGTGFIGQALTKALVRRGWEVRALVRRPDSPQAQALRREGAGLVPGDVVDRESMRQWMTGADVVIHNAGLYEYATVRGASERMRSVNIDGTANVFALVKELGIPRGVHVSSVQATGETGTRERDETYQRQFPCRTVYEQSKTDAHRIARQYQLDGVPVVIVCPHGVIGANDHSPFGYFQRLYINGFMPPVAWSPDSIFSLVERDDLAEGISLAAERGRIGETYLLTGERQTIGQMFDSWGKAPGGMKPRLFLPAAVAKVLFAPLEPLQRRLGLPALLSREVVRAVATNWNYSSHKAQQELDWIHCSAEAMWSRTLEEEIRLLALRRGQSLVQRITPLELVN